MSKNKPFNLTDSAKLLEGTFPDKNYILNHLPLLRPNELDGFISLWLLEGFPHAFKSRPMIYDLAKNWLAEKLNINSNQVLLIGSGRTGYSLSPNDKFGRPFSNNSDLDFAIVSDQIFESLRVAYFKWRSDYLEGRVSPKNANQLKFWEDNRNRLQWHLQNGFINHDKIPYYPEYQPAGRIEDALSELTKKINQTDGSPNIKKTTLRVYRDWESFKSRMKFNLKAIRSARD